MDSAPPLSATARQALLASRPWLRVIEIYCWLTVLVTLASGVALVFGAPSIAEGGTLGAIYLLFVLLIVALLLPLRRMNRTLGELSDPPGTESSSAHEQVERYLVEQALFWRRAGMITAASLALLVLGLLVIVGANLLGG